MDNSIDASAVVATVRGHARVSDLAVGDRLLDATGQGESVLRISTDRDNRSCYRVDFDTGEHIVVEENHKWVTETYLDRSAAEGSADAGRGYRQGTDAEITRARSLADRADRTAVLTQTEAIRAMGWNASRGGMLVRHVARAGLSFERRGNTKVLHAHELWASLAAYLERAILARPSSVVARWRSLDNIARTLTYAGTNNHGIRVASPLHLPDAPLPVAPEVLGKWLAELGGAHGVRGGTADAGVVAPIAVVARALRSLGVESAPHIPPLYLRASLAQRSALLAGLENSPAAIAGPPGHLAFSSRRLACDVVELVSSLGECAHIETDESSVTDPDGGASWHVSFARKGPIFADPSPPMFRYITAIESVMTRTLRSVTIGGSDGRILVGRSLIPVSASVPAEAPRRASVREARVHVGEW